MNIDEKNKIIREYLKERFIEAQKKFPGIFSFEKYDRAVNMFKNHNDSLENIKLTIDMMIEKEIDIYIKRREANERLEKLKNQRSYYANSFKNNRETRTYEELKIAQEKMQELITKINLPLYLAGGMVPYLLLNQNSERLHDDIDYICDLKHMSKFRDLFKEAGLYDEKWDSLNFAQDGKDYGFEFKLNGTPIGIYPFTYTNGILTQYTYDPYDKNCKIKKIPLSQISDYVTSYKSVDGKIYNTQSLEIIKKSKDISERPKDKEDAKKIEEYGISQDIYDRIPLPTVSITKQASSLKSNKKKQLLQKKQLILSYAYNIKNPKKQDVLQLKNSKKSQLVTPNEKH